MITEIGIAPVSGKIRVRFRHYNYPGGEVRRFNRLYYPAPSSLRRLEAAIRNGDKRGKTRTTLFLLRKEIHVLVLPKQKLGGIA